MEPSSHSLFLRLMKVALILMLQLSFATVASTHRTLTVADGLPSNRVFDIARDHRGFAWFATDKGLARYDGAHIQAFSRYHTPGLSQSLWVRDILFDEYQQLWSAGKQGLEVLRPHSEAFQPITVLGRSAPLNIYSLFKAANQTLWVGAADGLYVLEPNPHSPSTGQRAETLKPVLTRLDGALVNFKILSITHTPNNLLLLATTRGLFVFDPASNNTRPVSLDAAQPAMADKLWTLDDGQIWIAMHGLGLGVYDVDTDTVQLIYQDPNEFDTVGYVFDLYKENNEIRAASLNTGLLSLTAETVTTTHSYPPLLSLYRDNSLRMYGTYSEGVIVESGNHSAVSNVRFTHPSETGKYEVNQLARVGEHLWVADQLSGLCRYTTDGEFERCISSESHSAQALAQATNGSLWAAMYHELLLVEPDTTQVKARYKLADYQIPAAINTLLSTTDDILWLAHSFDGLSRFNPKTHAITHLTSDNSQLLSDQVHHLAKTQNTLWLATSAGLQTYSPERAQFATIPSPGNQPFIAAYTVTPAPDGKVWVQTDRGLRCYDPARQSWLDLPEPLVRLNTTSLTFDHRNSVWIATGQGVWHWQADNTAMAFYNYGDGLFRRGYLENVATRSETHIWFASTEGVTRLTPDNLSQFNAHPQISELAITAPSGKQQHYYNFQSLPEIDPQHASLRFRLANGDLFNSTKQQFRYQLSGVADTWVELGNEHTLMIPRLPWGDYTLTLKATDNQGNWSEQISKIHFTVRTPWYATTFAKTSYILLAMAVLYLAYRFRIRTLEHRQQQLKATIRSHTQIMQEQNSQLEAAQKQRTALLKTLSHELMTPVTLIQGPAEQLRNSRCETQRNQMANLVISNTKRLKVLIEHLMQLSSNNEAIAPSSNTWGAHDLAAVLNEQIDVFGPLMNDKSIVCHTHLDAGVMVNAQPDQLPQLISNLLSNAIKYSYEGGEITVALTTDSIAQHATLSISDQGIGIDPEQHERIFDAEFRTETGHQFASGQGIGLSRVKEIVTQLNGQIQLTSFPDKGTCFTVSLPLTQQTVNSSNVTATVAVQQEHQDKTPSILLIDDTPDMLAFLHDILTPDYQLLTANNGKAGLALARAELPDMVISDVMMPIMDGLELTQQLKRDPLTAHIPMMLITANLSEEKYMKGLNLQADDYLTKPFNLSAFKLKISNTFALIEATQTKLRQQLHQHNQSIKSPHLAHSLESLTPKDQFADNPATSAFVDKLESVLSKHYSDPALSVTQLAKEMALSERQLHRKLTSVTSIGANEYMRQYRLYRALVLLRNGINVTQTAEQCGFNSPSYFSACFKKQFGLTAKQYTKEQLTNPQI